MKLMEMTVTGNKRLDSVAYFDLWDTYVIILDR